MKLAVMQPYFFPYLGYYQAIAAVDKYILYDNLSFIKEAWMNRNRILLRDGRIQMLTVPLLHKSSNTMIRDVEIDNSKPWRENMLLTISGAYKKAPYWKEVFEVVEDVLMQKSSLLKDLNAKSIIAVLEYLGIRSKVDTDCTRFMDMEEILASIENDYSILPYLERTRPIKKVARVIEMCRREGACFFYNAIGGQELYDKVEFSQYGINLGFVKTQEIRYQQCSKTDTFTANLSIIDVLMNSGREGTLELLDKYVII